MSYKVFKKALKGLRYTFLHPQWLIYKDTKRNFKEICNNINGRILDIGCADQDIKSYLPSSIEYIGLDYYQTATEMYKTTPDVFGDAQKLPFAAETMDFVLLLDVLEHIPESNLCLSEISRVLKSNGKFVLQVPFIYPVHDAPLDFQRWTLNGLIHIANKNDFIVKEINILGKAFETAGLICNLSICSLIAHWSKNLSSIIIISVIFWPAVVFINILSALLASISPKDDFMPHGYRLILEKESCDI